MFPLRVTHEREVVIHAVVISSRLFLPARYAEDARCRARYASLMMKLRYAMPREIYPRLMNSITHTAVTTDAILCQTMSLYTA